MNNRLLLGWAIVWDNKELNKKSFVSNKLHPPSKFNVHFTSLLNEARIYIIFPLALEMYREIIFNKINDISEENLKIVKLYGDYEEIDLSDDLYNSEIQKKAIKKLKKDEIRALNLEKIAMVVKLHEEEKNSLADYYPNEVKYEK